MTVPEGAGPGADIFAKLDDPRLEQLKLATSLGLMPFYREIEGEIGPNSRFGGGPVVMLGSNNYLGLTTDDRVRRAALDAVERYGTGVTGSRLLNGTLPIHRELEELLADWVNSAEQFLTVMPRDYRRVLEATELAIAEGRSVEQAVMESSHG